MTRYLFWLCAVLTLGLGGCLGGSTADDTPGETSTPVTDRAGEQSRLLGLEAFTVRREHGADTLASATFQGADGGPAGQVWVHGAADETVSFAFVGLHNEAATLHMEQRTEGDGVRIVRHEVEAEGRYLALTLHLEPDTGEVRHAWLATPVTGQTGTLHDGGVGVGERGTERRLALVESGAHVAAATSLERWFSTNELDVVARNPAVRRVWAISMDASFIRSLVEAVGGESRTVSTALRLARLTLSDDAFLPCEACLRAAHNRSWVEGQTSAECVHCRGAGPAEGAERAFRIVWYDRPFEPWSDATCAARFPPEPWQQTVAINDGGACRTICDPELCRGVCDWQLDWDYRGIEHGHECASTAACECKPVDLDAYCAKVHGEDHCAGKTEPFVRCAVPACNDGNIDACGAAPEVCDTAGATIGCEDRTYCDGCTVCRACNCETDADCAEGATCYQGCTCRPLPDCWADPLDFFLAGPDWCDPTGPAHWCEPGYACGDDCRCACLPGEPGCEANNGTNNGTNNGANNGANNGSFCQLDRNCPDGFRCENRTCIPDEDVCGDGHIDPGESCDPEPGEDDPCGGGYACVDCRCEVVCGDGERGPGEQCDGPENTCPFDSQYCTTDCQCEGKCGNGRIDEGEECDVSAGGGCSDGGDCLERLCQCRPSNDRCCGTSCTLCQVVMEGDEVLTERYICETVDGPRTTDDCGPDPVTGFHTACYLATDFVCCGDVGGPLCESSDRISGACRCCGDADEPDDDQWYCLQTPSTCATIGLDACQ